MDKLSDLVNKPKSNFVKIFINNFIQPPNFKYSLFLKYIMELSDFFDFLVLICKKIDYCILFLHLYIFEKRYNVHFEEGFVNNLFGYENFKKFMCCYKKYIVSHYISLEKLVKRFIPTSCLSDGYLTFLIFALY